MTRTENFDNMIQKMAKEVQGELEKINEEALRNGYSVSMIDVTDKLALRHVPRGCWDGMGDK